MCGCGVGVCGWMLWVGGCGCGCTSIRSSGHGRTYSSCVHVIIVPVLTCADISSTGEDGEVEDEAAARNRQRQREWYPQPPPLVERKPVLDNL